MQASRLLVLQFALLFPIDVLAVPIRSLPESSTSVAVTPAGGQHWSRQDILTLIGVCIAVVTVIIGLVGVLVASPATRDSLCAPVYWSAQRVRRSKHPLFRLAQYKV
jgi:hypothetical protein